MRLACTAPGGPPRSSEELLRRFDKGVLATLWTDNVKAAEVARIGVEYIDACRQRYRSLFDATPASSTATGAHAAFQGGVH